MLAPAQLEALDLSGTVMLSISVGKPFTIFAHILENFRGISYLLIVRPILNLKEVVVTVNLEICPFMR